MNKRGDVPTVVLVIGVFGICSLAMLSFFSANVGVMDSFSGVSVMEKINIMIEEAEFNGTSPNGFYLEENDTEFSPGLDMDWFKEKVIFSVTYEGGVGGR